MIVMVSGLPGSGKSFLAKALAARLNAVWLSSDAVRREMQYRGLYDEAAKAAVYREMLRRLTAVLKEHRSVVLDATWYQAAMREAFVEKAAELGQPLRWITVKASERTIRQRLLKKRADSEADFAVYLKIKAAFEPLTAPHLVLYSDRGAWNGMLDAAITYLNDPCHETQ